MAKPPPARPDKPFTPENDLHVVAATMAAAFVRPDAKDPAKEVIQVVQKYRQFVRVLSRAKGGKGGDDEG
jgi:hypothetical protein